MNEEIIFLFYYKEDGGEIFFCKKGDLWLDEEEIDWRGNKINRRIIIDNF